MIPQISPSFDNFINVCYVFESGEVQNLKFLADLFIRYCFPVLIDINLAPYVNGAIFSSCSLISLTFSVYCLYLGVFLSSLKESALND